MVREVAGTLVGRWYVTLFGVLSVRQLGWRRTGIYTAFAIAVVALAENASVHLGVPYTRYAFNNELRGDELFLGDVPLMVQLSYAFMACFSFASARLIVSGPHRSRSTMPLLEYLVAVTLAVWALWIIDPVSRLGAHFFLGELFRYEGPGFWFGLPLGSQIGFALTSAVLIGRSHTSLATNGRSTYRRSTRIRGSQRSAATSARSCSWLCPPSSWRA
jgi:uncharacterized membrane protein